MEERELASLSLGAFRMRRNVAFGSPTRSALPLPLPLSLALPLPLALPLLLTLPSPASSKNLNRGPS